MRITIDIDDDLIKEIMALTGVKSKRQAVDLALKKLKQAILREKLGKLIGNYKCFSLSLEELEKIS